MERAAIADQVSGYNKIHYSQTGEDGLLGFIFENIGTTLNPFFVDVGAADGVWLSNTAYFRITKGWKGLLFDGDQTIPNPEVVKEVVSAENVNSLFERHLVPKEYDLLSLDIDGNDFWVWQAIDEARFSARVCIVEFNPNFEDNYVSLARKYDPGFNPSRDTDALNVHYYGATLAAMRKLGLSKGYSLVCRAHILNLIFVRNDLLHPRDVDLPIECFINRDGKSKMDDGKHGNLGPSHTPYATTELNVYWPQDMTREWVNI